MDRIARIRVLMEKSPGDAFLYHALALEHIKSGDDAAARESFSRNLCEAPDYLATYYHLGKLEERAGNTDTAIQRYEQGMRVAKAAGDQHTFNELRGALEELT